MATTAARRHAGPAILASGLRAGYGSQVVLRDLDLSLPRGEVLAVLGPGGSGKSTLLNVIADPQNQNSDHWWSGDLKINSSGTALLSQDGPGQMEPGSLPQAVLSGRELEAVSSVLRAGPELEAELRRGFAAETRQSALWLRRMASYVTIVSGEHDLVLLDEPEVGLPDSAREHLAASVQSLRESRTVIVATHHLGFARAVAQRVILLVDGQVIEAGEAATFFERPSTARAQYYVRMGG